MRNDFKFGPMVQEMLFKIFLFLALVAILFSRAEWFMQFCKGLYREHSCEIISNLDLSF